MSVAMGEGMEVNVAVDRIGMGVNVLEGTDAGVSVGETGRGVQAANKTRRSIQKPERFMKISMLSNAIGAL